MGRMDRIISSLDGFNHSIYSNCKSDLEGGVVFNPEGLSYSIGRIVAQGFSPDRSQKGGKDMEKEESYLLEFTGAE